ncbi:class I poly(R)-hydroxyalkanoic acid synthase [Ideonella sp. B7]|uniref:class I poly(R)-hydroxyalkanoic acid synthase n=1 Tax=Ideonella benzenivorans TaxID=2831643 RepID=UPI001CEC930D|nr:class I poly(R)-hydroxyalkanoic acid synthase [Ideonella benzenivorans]MCA6216349.1 class I poly(R)-hydroxyalkanoic acid synthase [Ideonella benzenivorans]
MWKSMAGVSVPASVLSQVQADYLRDATLLWNSVLGPAAGEGTTPLPPVKDRRFSAPDWQQQPTTDYLARMYLLNARALAQMADAVQGDEKTRARIRFAVQQWIDAASPSNYLALNPEALRKAMESGGGSILQGLQHLWEDLRQGHVSQTDTTQFEVGRNVATTEGAVVYESELFQLIEYKPLTAKVNERPLLMVPPCINKYYIMDLQPANSLVRYAVAQGNRVFMLSWRNPDPSLASRTWDDYIDHAVIEAIHTVQAIAGAKQINTLGFCVGGTMLATALAVLAGRGEEPAASMTLLTTLLDYTDTGVLDVFVDEAAVQLREMTIGDQAPGGPGLLKGQELAAAFNFLRPNDLIWNYVVGNYLKGEMPPAFDLLYWNGDCTNLPGPMYCWYLRHTYLENQLREPGALTVCGQPLDLGKVTIPVYLYASRDDHIVPWQSAYGSTHIFHGPRRFTLGASGHIAGVINPPEARKRNHWVRDDLPATADEWLAGAREEAGSWWTDWSGWLAGQGGRQVAAPKTYGGRGYKAIEPAPGRYVRTPA